ncbi:O-methyltransferase [Leeuwenhoekiella nanhaiensis]|uniref:Methyltransferase n=1 Tax=Leeuwenhoekiella nanhaiensis TaxID=1655491 RepID=A0A2G1VPH5_9FLAO|nr:hypothetical protein [Leeuwenhoekiella nanhaiensis]PHQ28661.1 hypothetical protein CJ305_14225 [Leeuwenhoekiella nanhaiensis]
MIKRIKRIINEFRTDNKKLFYKDSQIWASLKLQSLFGEHFIPHTSWTMTPQAIVHALNIIAITKPKAVIEFGSGATTIYIAKLISMENRYVQFYSVESDELWMSQIKELLIQQNLEKYVKFIHAPIVQIESNIAFQNQKKWYDPKIIRKKIESVDHFDFVIVDGPWGATTPYARYSAFPVLKDLTSTSTKWLLDDTDRPEEMQIAEMWKQGREITIYKYKRYSILQDYSQYNMAPYNLQ